MRLTIFVCRLSRQDATKTGSQDQLERLNNEKVKVGHFEWGGVGGPISVNFAKTLMHIIISQKVVD